MLHDEDGSDGSYVTRKTKRFRIEVHVNDSSQENAEDCSSDTDIEWDEDISQREMRDWLCKLWTAKPKMRELIWKGACLALNAGKWSECMLEICAFHQLPSPLDDDRLPVGSGSNPVYLAADHVIKIFVEGGLESCILGLGTELEFYSSLHQVNSPLKNHVPEVVASGILFKENGSYTVVQWDGKEVPDKLFEYRIAGMSIHESSSILGSTEVWPYIITKRCEGKMFAQLRDTLPGEDVLELASFLGEQLRNLHLLPCPSHTLNETCLDSEIKRDPRLPAEWELSIGTLARKKLDVSKRLTMWGEPIPQALIEKVHEYLPDDFSKLLNDVNGQLKVCKRCTWIHSDIMDDNIFLERCPVKLQHGQHTSIIENGSPKAKDETIEGKSWRPKLHY
ncbi:unnamed protein product [Rhodiola kirilowii]